jgi:membrane associated rhomboid family serine protease
MDPFTPVVKYLIFANILVFLLQIFITRKAPLELPEDLDDQIAASKETDAEQQQEALRKARRQWEQLQDQMPGLRISVVQEWFELNPSKTFKQGQVWRLLTCAFCHMRESLWHILFNMLMLYWFGTRLETMYGSREFLLFYLTAALCASLAYLGLDAYTGANVPAIGASGAVMGVMMLYTIYYPTETFLIFWVIPVPLWALLSVYVLYDLHPVLLALAGDRLYTGVAHAGHLGGLAFGFVYWRLGLRLEAPFDRSGPRVQLPKRRPQRAAPAAVAAQPARDPLDDQVDEILRKISEKGKESLTDDELGILQRASAKYRSGKA